VWHFTANVMVCCVVLFTFDDTIDCDETVLSERFRLDGHIWNSKGRGHVSMWTVSLVSHHTMLHRSVNNLEFPSSETIQEPDSGEPLLVEQQTWIAA
jgi:hypothetical protein